MCVQISVRHDSTITQLNSVLPGSGYVSGCCCRYLTSIGLASCDAWCVMGDDGRVGVKDRTYTEERERCLRCFLRVRTAIILELVGLEIPLLVSSRTDPAPRGGFDIFLMTTWYHPNCHNNSNHTTALPVRTLTPVTMLRVLVHHRTPSVVPGIDSSMAHIRANDIYFWSV